MLFVTLYFFTIKMWLWNMKIILDFETNVSRDTIIKINSNQCKTWGILHNNQAVYIDMQFYGCSLSCWE